ncbi:MAG: tRNA dihydrouridine(20/20a) synthase DusA [Geminicoccaceae bacterium]
MDAPHSCNDVTMTSDTVPSSTRRLSVAPMMDWTDRHCRQFHRLLAPRALLYTEMVHAGAVLHGDVERHLGFAAAEHPVALQLGGCEPAELARAATVGAAMGYDEINLNCGCPSDRVQRGRFGACLMAEPARVADAVAAMAAAVSVPVTVKCRIGIDDSEEFDFLARFVATIRAAGCRTFIVHARKAWLKGLSPKENREVPPLRHDVVHRLKREFPELQIVLNGGLREPTAALDQMRRVDGVMIGREAYENPWSLTTFHRLLIDDGAEIRGRHEIVEAMAAYAAAQGARGVPIRAVVRHMLGLFNGLPGARAWRRRLSAVTPTDPPSVLLEAASLIQRPCNLAA